MRSICAQNLSRRVFFALTLWSCSSALLKSVRMRMMSCRVKLCGKNAHLDFTRTNKGCRVSIFSVSPKDTFFSCVRTSTVTSWNIWPHWPRKILVFDAICVQTGHLRGMCDTYTPYAIPLGVPPFKKCSYHFVFSKRLVCYGR